MTQRRWKGGREKGHFKWAAAGVEFCGLNPTARMLRVGRDSANEKKQKKIETKGIMNFAERIRIDLCHYKNHRCESKRGG